MSWLRARKNLHHCTAFQAELQHDLHWITETLWTEHTGVPQVWHLFLVDLPHFKKRHFLGSAGVEEWEPEERSIRPCWAKALLVWARTLGLFKRRCIFSAAIWSATALMNVFLEEEYPFISQIRKEFNSDTSTMLKRKIKENQRLHEKSSILLSMRSVPPLPEL